jgi:CRISP-associated protein Cas1
MYTESQKPGNNDDLWATRGEFWLNKINPKNPYTPRTRRRINKPLVLSGHGINLSIDSQTLLIKCGFTHYPQAKEQYRYFPQDRRLPSRIVILDGDGSITLKAMQWLSEQQVPLVQINWRGEIVSTSATNYSADTDIVYKQYKLKETKQSFDFAKDLIRQKLLNCIDTIKQVSEGHAEGDATIAILNERADSLTSSPPQDTPLLLTLEGIAAAAYFRYWFFIYRLNGAG